MGPLRPAVPSLRSAFAWSFAGNVVNGFSAWAVLALVARLTSIEFLGQYALAVAVASPVAMLAHLNLRMVLATDVSGEHSDADYFRVRMWSAAAGLIITAAIGLAWRPFLAVGLTIVLVGANFAVENIEDLYYAVMQRSERLDQVARSMVLRGLLGIALIAVLLRTFPAPAAAAGGMLLSRIITLFSYDVRKATASAGTVTAPGEVFLRAAPLGLTLMLVSFTSAIPRYVVEHWLGSARLGAFAAVMSFITVGSVIINALGQSATTRLARSFRSGRFVGLPKIGFAPLRSRRRHRPDRSLGRRSGRQLLPQPCLPPRTGAISAIAGAGAPRRNHWIRRRNAGFCRQQHSPLHRTAAAPDICGIHIRRRVADCGAGNRPKRVCTRRRGSRSSPDWRESLHPAKGGMTLHPILLWVYRSELARYQSLLVQVLLARTIGYVAAMLGFVVTSVLSRIDSCSRRAAQTNDCLTQKSAFISVNLRPVCSGSVKNDTERNTGTRRFTQQLPLLTLAAFTSNAISLTAVPAIGLKESELAIAVAGAVQIGGNIYILRRAA